MKKVWYQRTNILRLIISVNEKIEKHDLKNANCEIGFEIVEVALFEKIDVVKCHYASKCALKKLVNRLVE